MLNGLVSVNIKLSLPFSITIFPPNNYTASYSILTAKYWKAKDVALFMAWDIWK